MAKTCLPPRRGRKDPEVQRAESEPRDEAVGGPGVWVCLPSRWGVRGAVTEPGFSGIKPQPDQRVRREQISSLHLTWVGTLSAPRGHHHHYRSPASPSRIALAQLQLHREVCKYRLLS